MFDISFLFFFYTTILKSKCKQLRVFRTKGEHLWELESEKWLYEVSVVIWRVTLQITSHSYKKRFKSAQAQGIEYDKLLWTLDGKFGLKVARLGLWVSVVCLVNATFFMWWVCHKRVVQPRHYYSQNLRQLGKLVHYQAIKDSPNTSPSTIFPMNTWLNLLGGK